MGTAWGDGKFISPNNTSCNHKNTYYDEKGEKCRNCPLCQRREHPNMGEYLSVKRATGHGKCKWCGNENKRMYAYAATVDDAFFFAETGKLYCNKDCYTSYQGTWPSSAFGPLPIEKINRRDYEL